MGRHSHTRDGDREWEEGQERRERRTAEVARVRAIIADGSPQYDDDGSEVVDMASCGTCGRSWNDARISSLTPAPSGRCPFGYAHLQRLGR